MERTDKLDKVLCDLKTWKVCLGRRWVESIGVPGLKVGYDIALLKWQEKGLPAEGSFLQRGAYTGRII